MIGKNFYKDKGYHWNENDEIIVCSEGEHTLFTIFRSDHKEELINAYKAGLAAGMNQGRKQGVRDFIGMLGLRIR